MAASAASALPAVRRFLFHLQRDTAAVQDVIMDGRDIGTVVLPDARLKIFLTASAEDRAARRTEELREKGIEADFDEVLADMRQRDYNDENRQKRRCVRPRMLCGSIRRATRSRSRSLFWKSWCGIPSAERGILPCGSDGSCCGFSNRCMAPVPIQNHRPGEYPGYAGAAAFGPLLQPHFGDRPGFP